MSGRGFFLCMALALSAACATKAVAPANPLPTDSSQITRFISRGSYEDLRTAFEKTRSVDTKTAYQIALLLAARSKELGIRHSEWIEVADQLMPEKWQRYSDIIRSLSIDPLSGDRELVMKEAARFGRLREVIETWRAELRSDERLNPIVRSYLSLSLACGPQMYAQREAAAKQAMDDHPDIPILVYRAGVCTDPTLLTTLTDFPDADFELGRAALAQAQTNEDAGLNHFQRAWHAFPSSAVIAFSIDSIYERREEWAKALEYFNAALSLAATHRDALLGKTVALSRLRQHDGAVATATTLIELQGWYLAEAHYWRSWNRYQLNDLPNARADVERSKQISTSPAALVLSGIVAWREGKLVYADEELAAALKQDFGYCEAAFYLGQVRADAHQWSTSDAALTHAEQCFGLAVETNRKAAAALSGSDSDKSRNARQIAVHHRAIAEAEEQRAAAAKALSQVRQFANVQ